MGKVVKQQVAQATFEEMSASDFFYRNRDIAGLTNPSRSIFVAIRELVENSLDAAESQKIPPDIYVRLSFESEATKDTQIYKLRVEDNGSGIEKKYIRKVFMPFFRVPSGNIHNVKGSGLGLSYVKRICDLHGWKIMIESEPGKGTVITIIIPKAN